MVIKKVNNKAQNTVTGLVMSLLLVIAIFTGGYIYIVSNVESSGLVLNESYASIYGNVTSSQTDLDNNIKDIRNSFNNITEAENVVQVAWNGLRGLGSALKLPINFVSTTIHTWDAIVPGLSYVPGWVITLVIIGLTGFVVLLVFKILKGEPNM